MIAADTLDIEDLPDSLTEVIDAIGFHATLELVAQAGGTRIYVPEAMDAEHRLAEWLGLDAAAALSARFGCDSLTIPRCLVGLRRVRDRAIRGKHDAGAATAALAREYHLTERQIYTILAADDAAESPQQALF